MCSSTQSNSLLEENKRGADLLNRPIASKVFGAVPAAGPRRALGDIGNALSGSLTSRVAPKDAAYVPPVFTRARNENIIRDNFSYIFC